MQFQQQRGWVVAFLPEQSRSTMYQGLEMMMNCGEEYVDNLPRVLTREGSQAVCVSRAQG